MGKKMLNMSLQCHVLEDGSLVFFVIHIECTNYKNQDLAFAVKNNCSCLWSIWVAPCVWWIWCCEPFAMSRTHDSECYVWKLLWGTKVQVRSLKGVFAGFFHSCSICYTRRIYYYSYIFFISIPSILIPLVLFITSVLCVCMCVCMHACVSEWDTFQHFTQSSQFLCWDAWILSITILSSVYTVSFSA